MKKEYKIIGATSLWGFMEGNAKFIEGTIRQRLKMQYGVEPEYVVISTTTPYKGLGYPVILLSMRIDGVAWSIVRDTQAEADRDEIKSKIDPTWNDDWDFTSDDDILVIRKLINKGII